MGNTCVTCAKAVARSESARCVICKETHCSDCNKGTDQCTLNNHNICQKCVQSKVDIPKLDLKDCDLHEYALPMKTYKYCQFCLDNSVTIPQLCGHAYVTAYDERLYSFGTCFECKGVTCPREQCQETYLTRYKCQCHSSVYCGNSATYCGKCYEKHNIVTKCCKTNICEQYKDSICEMCKTNKCIFCQFVECKSAPTICRQCHPGIHQPCQICHKPFPIDECGIQCYECRERKFCKQCTYGATSYRHDETEDDEKDTYTSTYCRTCVNTKLNKEFEVCPIPGCRELIFKDLKAQYDITAQIQTVKYERDKYYNDVKEIKIEPEVIERIKAARLRAYKQFECIICRSQIHLTSFESAPFRFYCCKHKHISSMYACIVCKDSYERDDMSYCDFGQHYYCIDCISTTKLNAAYISCNQCLSIYADGST